MTPEAQNRAIVEACGWIKFYEEGEDEGCGKWFWHKGNQNLHKQPDYLNDLNVMREAEKTLRPDGQRHWFLRYLHDICANEVGSQFCEEWDRQQASSAQRAKAFLKAIGKWQD